MVPRGNMNDVRDEGEVGNAGRVTSSIILQGNQCSADSKAGFLVSYEYMYSKSCSYVQYIFAVTLS